MKALEVIRAGPLATVQDLGRPGYRRFGMVVSGAMDAFALQVANLLVGNTADDACVEIAGGGLAIRSLRDQVACICGADLGATIDGKCAPLWQSFLLKEGQELALGGSSGGLWAYLAIAGGVRASRVMGSRSTYLRGRIGGVAGRPLARGDVLLAAAPAAGRAGRGLASGEIPRYGAEATVRVVLGPQEHLFTQQAVERLLNSAYKVSPTSDRMGYRLKGPALVYTAAGEMFSDALCSGAIQVPGDGKPIILLADHQTTGGYPKIAAVISHDLPLVAQLRPNDSVRFAAVTVEQAQELHLQQVRLLRRLQAACAQ